MGKGRPLTEFEKNLREEIFKRDNHIENSVKYAIDRGDDYGVLKNTPQWRRDAIEKYKNEHKTSVFDDDGNEVGKISYEARRAIRKNKISDYKPQNDDEKKVFDYLKNRRAEREKSASELKKKTENELFSLKNNKNRLGGTVPNVINLHDRAASAKALGGGLNKTAAEQGNKLKYICRKYNIDADNFSSADLKSWADKHNYEIKVNSSGIYYTPKFEGGLFGIGGKKKSTAEEDNDFKILEQLAENNSRRTIAQTDNGKLAAAAISAVDSGTLGLASKISDYKAKKDYENVGLDSDNYISPSEAWQKSKDEHAISSGIGDIAGSALSLVGAGNIAAGALSSVPGFAKLSIPVQKAIQTSVTFAGADAVKSAASRAWSRDEWDRREERIGNIYRSNGNEYQKKDFSIAKNILEVFRDGVAGGVSGYLGSQASSVISSKILEKLAHTNLSIHAIKGLSQTGGGMAFAAAATAANEANNFIKAVSKGEKYNPDFEGIAKNIIITGLYSGVMGYAESKLSAAAAPELKEKFEYFTDEDMKDPDTLKKKMRELTKQYHPDRGGNAEIMKKVNDEYSRAKIKVASNVGNALKNDMENGTVNNDSQSLKNAVAIVNEAAEERANINAVSKAVSHSNAPAANPLNEANITSNADLIVNTNNTPDDSPSAYADDEQIHDASENLAESNAGVSVQQLESGVKKLTDNLTAEYKSSYIKNIPNYQTVYNENLRLSSTPGKVVDEQFVRTYALSYAEGLRQNNSKAYKKLSAVSDDVGGMLSDYILRNKIPQGIETNEDMSALYRTAGGLKKIINRAANAVMSANNQIYGKSDTLTEAANEINRGNYSVIEYENVGEISLSKVGEYYEAYGTDAVKLKNLIPVSTHYTERNGSKTLVAAIPAGNINEYINTLKLSANAYSAGGREFISLTQNTADTTNGSGASERKTDAYESNSNIEVSENEISVSSKPSAQQVSEISFVISRDPSIPLILNGNEKSGETVLFYAEEEDTSRERIENDINSYYDGVMPEIGTKIPNEYDEDMKFSVESVDGTDKKYVKADRQVISGENPEEWRKQVYNYINTSIRKGKNINVLSADGDVLTITEDTAGKARFRNTIREPSGNMRKMTNDEFAVKLRAESHIDEIAEVSKKNGYSAVDTKNHNFAKDGFYYRTAYFEDFDGKYYKLTLSVGKSGEINTVYNVGKLKETYGRARDSKVVEQKPNNARRGFSNEVDPFKTAVETNNGLRGGATSDNNNISQSDEAVNSSIRENAENDTDIKFSQDKSLDGGGGISYNDDINIPYRESVQLREYIIAENNRNGSELKAFDKKEIGDNFYVWRNNSKTDYDVIAQVEIDGNEDIIDALRKGLENGEIYIDKGTKGFNDWFAAVRSGQRSDNSNNAVDTAELSNGNDDRLYSRQSSDDDGIKFARESGRNQQNTEVDNYGRDDILNGDDRRTPGKSEGERGSGFQEIAGNAERNAGEEQSGASSRRIYARDVKEAGGVERRTDRGVEADFVKPEYYNDEMRRIAAENDERGVITHFILGNGRALRHGTNFRGAVRGNEVYIQADHGKYSPSQINRHEIIHRNYSTDTVLELKNRILSRLTNKQINDISERLYRDYAQKRRSFDEIFEEFVCDVLADMNDYAEMFSTETREYWTAEEQERKGYSPSTYTESIDAGGKSGAVISVISKNIDKISNENKFDIDSDKNISSYKTKSNYINDVFKRQGNIAENPIIGKVELTKSGAKSTIHHGFGEIKLAAVPAIKTVIEKGNIIDFLANYKGNGVDRYILAAKGTIDGKSVIIGAVVKAYPEQKHNAKFYLHEVKTIEANSFASTAPQLSVDTVNEFTSKSGVSHTAVENNATRVNEQTPIDINISQNDSVVNSNIRENSGNDTRINTEDVKAIQSIPKKSVNDFTSEDIKKTENFAKKYYSEMGEKSPFFRAWFGDWRANDKSEVAVADKKRAVRGATKNLDTGWNIQISGKVFNETKSHNQNYNVKARPYLDYINSIVENAVLLDSYTVPSGKAKSSNSAMMHSLYVIADMGSGRELVKLYVEELNDVNSDGTIKRAYQLQNITKQQLNDRVQGNTLAPSASTADTYTVSQLFDLVKRLDKNFKPNEVSKVVNADGTPRVVYHGTDSDFTVFDIMQTGKNFNDMSSGMFFFTKYKDGYPNSATDYARHSSENNGGNPNIMGAYLDIKKPLILDSKGYYSTNEYYDINAENIYEKFLGGDYDGVIVENSDNSSDDSVLYVVDSSSRIKSATDNIGTFDRGNDDIRFSADENVNTSISGDEDTSYLSEPVKNIKNDIREVRLRAEASHGKVFDRKDINEVCDSILNNVNTGAVRGIEIKSKKDRTVISVLVNRVLNSAGVDAKRKHTRALARFIAQNATAYDSKSLSAADGVDYESDKAVITSYIKHGVKLSPDAKEAVISVVGESSAKGYISMMSNENALGIDAVYDELRLVMPGYFTEDLLSDGDKMRRVMEVYTWLKEGRDLQEQKLIDIMDESDRREFTDILSQQLDDAFETRGRESLLDLELVKERQRQEKKIKALEDKYRDKISELRSKAENKVKNSAEKKKIEVKQERYKFKSLSEAVSKYGRIKEGEKPYRETAVPRKIDKDRYVSRFARTMVEAGVTPNEALSEFEERILSGDMTYERITDEKAKNYAEEKIKRRGFLKSLEDWDEMILSNQRIGKNEMAFGQMLYNQCINAKDAKHAMKIAADLATIATQAGQAVQACQLLKQMSPDCQLYSLEQAVSKMEDEFRQQLKLLSGKNRDIDIKINESLAQEYLNAKTQEERDIVMDKLLEDIADQIPPSLKDKWDSWRYLSMLGNPRTHIRNIGGNLVFMLPVHLKNTLSYIAEKAIPKGQRTKSYIKTAESKEFAKQDYIKMKDIIQGNSGKFEGISKINELRRIYKFKPLEGLRKANFAALEWEDGIFLKHHYENALAQITTARGYTAEFLNSGTSEARAALEAARAYAINEAQKATYRDANAAAEAISSAQRKLQNSKYFAGRAAGLALEGVVPFKKTPLNIVKRGIEYSPVGLINGVYDMAFNIKSGKTTAAEAIDKLASGLVGTALTVLGMWLASIGLVRGDGDDDKNAERLDNATGEQSYSVRIGKHSYTIDWVAPASMPFFVGVNIQKAFASDKKFTFEDIVKALVKIPDPIMSLSVLSSLSDLLSAGNYADTGAEKAAAYAWQTATSYVGQAYPTMFGQIARTIDKAKRNTYYADTENGIPDGLERFINRQLAKTPGASRLIEPKIDMWGREETYGDTWYGRFVGNTLSPGYYKEIDSTALDDELRRLNEEYEGDGSVLPPKIPKYFTYEKQKYYMNPSEYTKYSVIRGQKSFEAADELIRTDDYKNKSAEEKKKALEKCYDAAGDKAKNEILKGRGIDVAEKEAEKEQSKKKSKSKSSNKRFR